MKIVLNMMPEEVAILGPFLRGEWEARMTPTAEGDAPTRDEKHLTRALDYVASMFAHQLAKEPSTRGGK